MFLPRPAGPISLIWRSMWAFIFILSLNSLSAQTFNYKRFTTENGLPSNEVYNVLSDKDGFLWMITDNGVIRYDGFSFLKFDYHHGLPRNTVIYMEKDSRGWLWFMSIKGEFCYYDYKGFHLCDFNGKIGEVIGSKLALDFTVNEDKSVEMFFRGTDYLVFDSLGKTLTSEIQTKDIAIIKYQNGESFNVQCIPKPAEEIMVRYSDESTSFEVQIETYKKTKETWYMRACPLADGSVLLSVGDMLYQCRNGMAQRKIEFPTTINHLFQTATGGVFVAGNNSGAYYASSIDQQFESIEFLSTSRVSSIDCDREGGIWFSTTENGVYYVPNPEVLHLELGSNPTKVNALDVARNNVVAADANGNLFVLENRKVVSGFQNVSSEIFDLIYDETRNTVYCTAGFPSFVRKDSRLNLSFKGVVSIGNPEIINDMIVSGTIQALMKSDPINPEKQEKLTHQSDRISCLHYFQDTIFVGNYTGLYFLDNGMLVPYARHNHIFNFRITSIGNKGDNLLVGTREFGLAVLNHGKLTEINESNGLAGNQVRKIHDDEKGALVSTSEGVSYIWMNEKSPFPERMLNYSMEGGISGNDCFDAIQLNGFVYIATNKGIDIVGIEQAQQKRGEIPLFFNSVFVNGKTLNMENLNLTLGWNQNKNIVVNFDAVSFRNVNQTSFRYRISYNDTNWYETKNRSITFPVLPDGKYLLNIQPLDDGKLLSNPIDLTLSIHILPPYWKTWWFRITMIVLAIVIVVAINFMLTRRNVRMALRAAAQRSAVDKERIRIATDMHDDLGSDLTKMSMLTHEIEKETEVQLRSRLSKINAHLQGVLSKMDEVIWMMNPRNDSYNDLCSYVHSFALEFFENTKIKCKVHMTHLENDILIPAVIKRNAFLAAKEIFSNIAKHSRATDVEIYLFKKEDSLIFECVDNGVGFELNKIRSRGNGLGNLISRMKENGGDFVAYKKDDSGMYQKFSLPLKPKNQPFD